MKKEYRIFQIISKEVAVEYSDYYRGMQITSESIRILEYHYDFPEIFETLEDAESALLGYEGSFDDLTILPIYNKSKK